jgi:hypothetical protein
LYQALLADASLPCSSSSKSTAASPRRLARLKGCRVPAAPTLHLADLSRARSAAARGGSAMRLTIAGSASAARAPAVRKRLTPPSVRFVAPARLPLGRRRPRRAAHRQGQRDLAGAPPGGELLGVSRRTVAPVAIVVAERVLKQAPTWRRSAGAACARCRQDESLTQRRESLDATPADQPQRASSQLLRAARADCRASAALRRGSANYRPQRMPSWAQAEAGSTREGL